MNKTYLKTLRFPQKDFDLIKEGAICFGITAILVLGAACIFGAPYRPAVTNQQIAKTDPILFEQSVLSDLNGQGSMSGYGPPYNHGTGSVQSLAGFHPQTWWGTPYKLNTAQDDVITPLTMLATASNNSDLRDAMQTYESASSAAQTTWDNNFAAALSKATVKNGNVDLASGNYGPVATMMNSELSLANSGLLSGALDNETNSGLYRWNVQNDLLFLQDQALPNIAQNLNMQGNQWGINHDEAAYPGPWWLTPYTFLYQVPPWSTSSAADEMAAYTIGFLFVLLTLLPWVPGLNKLPRLIPIYKLIWRDWYKIFRSND